MQFIDLKAQQARIRKNIEKRIQTVMDHGKYIMGPEVFELEEKLAAYVGVKHCISCSSGTDALLIPLMAKGIGKGDAVLTTPFTYIATAEVIALLGATPIFVDIHPEYLTIDETKIEAAITPRTSAILVTHVFGNPCAVEEIETIAKKHNLKVIYDAAHCFGVTYKGKSIFEYGDVSTCSFHATKVFHTGEGGALFTNNTALFDKLFYHHNFGHKGALEFYGLGINAKISELQAAMGLAVFPYIDAILKDRKRIVELYAKELNEFQQLKLREETQWNYAYFPILFDSEEQLLKVSSSLNEKEIFPRRYFYPSLDELPYVNDTTCPISQSISKRVMCLPLFYKLDVNIQSSIIHIIKGS